jgi:hypothetical protein
MPLIAGPGAITVVITLASQFDSWESTWMALLAVGVNLLIMAAAFVFLAGYLSKLSDRAIESSRGSADWSWPQLAFSWPSTASRASLS